MTHSSMAHQVGPCTSCHAMRWYTPLVQLQGVWYQACTLLACIHDVHMSTGSRYGLCMHQRIGSCLHACKHTHAPFMFKEVLMHPAADTHSTAF